jgi:ribosomal protein L12E/L44/L45/RPP1/RPP2
MMKRFVVMVVALMFVFCTSAMAAEKKNAPAEPQKKEQQGTEKQECEKEKAPEEKIELK